MRAALLAICVLSIASCNKDSKDDDDDVYLACEEPEDCVVPEDRDAVCLEKADEGFCSWECDADSDCDDADDGDFDFVCASFESEEALYCFPACNEDAEEEEDECPGSMTCRSTGGGSDNRKICFPEE